MRIPLVLTAFVAAAGFANRVPPARIMSRGGLVVAPSSLTGLVASDTAAAREDVLRGEPGTYIGRILAGRDSTLERWHDRTASPIRVWIESPGTDHANFVPCIRTAFNDWDSVGLPVHFIFVDQSAHPEVSIRWTPQLVNKTGNTVWRADRHGWMESAEIVLATHLSDGRAIDVGSLHAIALHEIGHSLGMGHSENLDDVMAPLVRVAVLSSSDRATARLLYALPAGRVR